MKKRWLEFRNKRNAEQPVEPERHSTTLETSTEKTSLAEELLNHAYNTLQEDEPKLINIYEKLLSEELGELIADTPIVRRAQLQRFVEQCLARADKEFQKKKKVVRAVQTANNIKDVVAAGLKPSPQATLVWAALTAILPLVLNASEQSIKNVEGIDLVLDIHKKADILALRQLLGPSEQLRRKATEQLYAKILLFLIKSVVYYNQRSISRILGDSVKLDDWDEQLKAVRDADMQLDTFLTRMIPLSKEDNECPKKLHLTNPEDDKTRIEQRAGQLRDCYKWILDHPSYKHWVAGNDKLLWIKGGPGKGKTMLLCGIINQGVSAYFFCQAPYEKSNNDNAAAVLRGLIWMLAKRNPDLIHHIRNVADQSSDSVWSDVNAFTTLSRILKDMLTDLPGTVLVIDALDECSQGRDELIEFVLETSESTRWLVSSRRLPDIETMFSKLPCLSLDLETAVGDAVNGYIKIRVQELSILKNYDPEMKTFIEHYLLEHPMAPFYGWLWFVEN
ncbi:MAG: hypothetical protein GOMPHAMPRED_002764 [Gomphillus americanus]|uniref:NACHT domain-containing protein n=1 Tax=Gomphillus americanus TaxID=1940652 RepID=A0A8H3FEP3_9LECA|nr:MAG: hypothetical protein GOMPHAMPRED_002764 [Gomphillus americanus]